MYGISLEYSVYNNNSLCVLMRKYQIYFIHMKNSNNKGPFNSDNYCEHNIEYTHLVVIHYAMKHNRTVLLINVFLKY